MDLVCVQTRLVTNHFRFCFDGRAVYRGDQQWRGARNSHDLGKYQCARESEGFREGNAGKET